MITFRGELTPKIYAKALRVHAGPVTIVGISIALVALGAIAFLASRGASVFTAVLLFFFGLYLLAKPRYVARKILSTSELLRQPFEGSADRTEIVWSTPHADHVLPPPLRVADLHVRIPRYQVAMLEHIAERKQTSVSNVLTRELENTVNTNAQELPCSVDGFDIAMRWPSVAVLPSAFALIPIQGFSVAAEAPASASSRFNRSNAFRWLCATALR